MTDGEDFGEDADDVCASGPCRADIDLEGREELDGRVKLCDDVIAGTNWAGDTI